MYAAPHNRIFKSLSEAIYPFWQCCFYQMGQMMTIIFLLLKLHLTLGHGGSEMIFMCIANKSVSLNVWRMRV